MPIAIYHITHVDNLASIAAGGLLCDNLIAEQGLRFASIANSAIKTIRARTDVPGNPGGTLADYVPFYFAPRSPMLYTINQGNVGSVRDRQTHIVHLVLDGEEIAAEQACTFTDGHAIMGLSNFYDDLADLDRLDWPSIESIRWGHSYDPSDETRRKKQSEFLAHQHVAWDRVRMIGVASERCAARVADALEGVGHRPPVRITPDWYY